MFSIKSVFWNLCQWLFKCLNCSSATPHCLPDATTHSKDTHPSLAPFQSHLLHLHSVSPNVACFSLTNKLCSKEFCGSPVPHYTIWHWDEVHWISQGFLCVSQMWRGEQSNKTQSFFSCCSRTCPAHFAAQAQLCRTVLSNSISVQDYLSHKIHQA